MQQNRPVKPSLFGDDEGDFVQDKAPQNLQSNQNLFNDGFDNSVNKKIPQNQHLKKNLFGDLEDEDDDDEDDSIFSSTNKNLSPLNYKDDEPISSGDSVQQDEKLTSKDLEDVTKLSLKLKKKTIQSSSFSSQTFPMLVSLMVENIKTTYKAPLDLICVIDRSGSMMGKKIQLVKESFTYLLKFLRDSDRLSIIIFDDRASRIIPLMRMTEANKEIALKKLQDVRGRGGTNINLGMCRAFEVLKQRREMNPVSSIFLLSDGLDEGAQQKVKSSLERYSISEDITINTFGFGNDHDPQLMSDIADLRDGNFYFVEKLDTVDEAFVDCLGGLLSSLGQNVTIKISPEKSNIFNEDVEIVKAYGEASMWAKEGNSYITKVSNIISGRQKDFVLELKIPINQKELQDHEKSVKVASTTVTMTGLNGKIITKTTDLFITLLNEIEEVKEEEEADRDVMKNFYRVKGASILSEAKKLADKSKYEEAKKLLQSFKEELEGSFLKEEEFIKNLIKDINKASEDVNPDVYDIFGRHNMMENARAQMHQKVNLKSANCYQNEVQVDMLREVKSMKSKKTETLFFN